MGGDLEAAMSNADPGAGDRHLDRLADQPPWHGVGVGLQLDRAVGLDPAHQFADLPEWRPPVDLAQGRRFGAREALDWLLAGCAVDVIVGDLTHPPPEMRFERRPADEWVPGDRIAFDVTDTAPGSPSNGQKRRAAR
jgi:hypothetical protein